MFDVFIDAGNTRLKAWLCLNGEIEARISVEHRDGFHGALENLFSQLATQQKVITNVYCVSVLSAPLNQQIIDVSNATFAITPQFARVLDSEALGIQCGYEQPERLGIDRWLGVVAVADGVNDYCVVDSGTALTIDLVSSKNEHLGGYIVPGLRVMVDSLVRNTQQIRVDDTQSWTAELGKNTNAAVCHGAVLSGAGAIELAMQRYQKVYGREPVLVLTGGTAELLAAVLDREYRLEPELLLRGLQRYFSKVGIKH